MVGILSKTTNPALNLATEEYLLKNFDEDVFFLYINKPSIIVGKHQNTLVEIDYNYTQKNSIPVYRRLSGGGTVYHDLGNLNFCFITNEEKGNLVNFDKHSTPIVQALETLGLTVEIGKRHDLSIAGKKITGTASHVFKNRAMHHGTLLFQTDLTVLNRCLNTDPQKISSKAVKSVRSTVTNISEHLNTPMTMEEFSSFIFSFLKSNFPDVKTKHLLSEKYDTPINILVKEKYSTWKWNWGYSPFYKLSARVEINGETITSNLTVEKGIVSSICFNGENSNLLNKLNSFAISIKGIQHSREAVLSAISELSSTVTGLTQEDLFKLIF